MKQANLVFMLALAAAVVIFKIATRNTAEKPNATGGTPVVPLASSVNVPITEAAYHQDSSDQAGAFGPDENTDGEEATSIL